MSEEENKKDWLKDGFYYCWFCNKQLTEDEVFWVGNIKRPVCEEHKDSLAKILNEN